LLNFKELITRRQNEESGIEEIEKIFEFAEKNIAEQIDKRPFDDCWTYRYKAPNGNVNKLRKLYEVMYKHKDMTQMEMSFEKEYDGPGPNYTPAAVVFEINAKRTLSK
jgi:hypothetical protein